MSLSSEAPSGRSGPTERLLELARELERAGASEKALGALRAAAAARPGDPTLERALARLAGQLIAKGRFEQAEQALEGLDPRSHEVALARGRVLRWTRRFPAAEAAFRGAIATRPEELEPYLLLAETQMNRGNLEAMFGTLRRADAARPADGDLPGSLRWFRLLVCRLDYEQAFALGERILDATRADRDLEWLRWQVFTEEFDYTPRPSAYVERARRELDRIARAAPRRPWAYYFRSVVGDGLHAATPRDTERLARLAGRRYGWMLLKPGLDAFNADQHRRAVPLLRAAARATAPGHWKAQVALCESLLCLGRPSAAGSALGALEALRPSPDGAGSELGECLAAEGRLLLWLGRYGEALGTLERALRRCTYDGFCWKGAALVKLGRYEEALEPLERATGFAFTPSWREARLWRAEALMRAGRAREAARACAALETEGDHTQPYAAAVAGLAGQALGQPRAAERALARLPALVRAALRGAGPAARLEDLLARSRGVRDARRALAIWLRR